MAKVFKVLINFTSDVLGLQPGDKDIYRDYIAAKAPDAPTMEQEVADKGIDAVVQNGITVFPRTADGLPGLYAYHWNGFFKETASFLNDRSDSFVKTVKAFKKAINGQVSVGPRVIPFLIEDWDPNVPMKVNTRPLRASTAQGERTSIASSEVVEAGAMMVINIAIYNSNAEKIIRECLANGTVHGTAQWRNAGYGQFTYEILQEVEIPAEYSNYTSAVVNEKVDFPEDEDAAVKAAKKFDKEASSGSTSAKLDKILALKTSMLECVSVSTVEKRRKEKASKE